MGWLYLIIAILFEVLATSSLKASNSFTELGPSVLVLVGYFSSFYFLSLTLRTIPLGIAYAVWSGVGVVLITLVGWFFYAQKLDVTAIFGIFLIATGVFVLNVFSKGAVN